MKIQATTHVVIPDTQAKSGVPTDHLKWIGQYIVDEFHDEPIKIIHLGDHADMPSLSSYDKGKKSMEGRRYTIDIKAANDAWLVLNSALEAFNKNRRKTKHRPWLPERHILLGNHEDRIARAVELDAQLEGVISTDDLIYTQTGWTVHPFLKPVELDGIFYSHYWQNTMTGKPLGGSALARLKTLGHSYTMGHQQVLDYAIRFVKGQSQHALVAGACLDSSHKVLTADLRYVPLGDIRVGDKLVSFDEDVAGRRARRFKTGTVLAVRKKMRETMRVELSDGQVFYATPDHRWLTRVGGQTSVREGATYMWRVTDQLRVGTRISKPLEYWEDDRSYEAGWLAGMLDGEGCLYWRNNEKADTQVLQLSVSQKPGLAYSQMERILEERYGVGAVTHTDQKGVNSLRFKGGRSNIAKILGSIRPVRLLSKFAPEGLGRLTNKKGGDPKVVSITPAGEREIVEIDIDAKTMIVEGYAHHNCYLHDEDYKGYQGNAHWRGIIVCHEVREGSYDPMFISLDYLCRRYENMRLADFMKKRYGVEL